jgi:hypothetical protein
MSYWSWLFGTGGRRAGARAFLDLWLMFHLVCGIFLSWVVPVTLDDAANRVLFPLAGVLVGLCFAWGGNAQALLQTDENQELSTRAPDGIVGYAYTYQTAILVLIVTMAWWGVSGLGVFDQTWPGKTTSANSVYFALKAFSYGLLSVALRECWHVVLSAQQFLIARAEIITARRKAPLPTSEQADARSVPKEAQP